MKLLFLLAVALGVGLAAVVDFRARRIPNYITLPLALSGLAFQALSPDGIGLPASLAGLGLGFCLLLVPAIVGGGGLGDVKLLAALGACWGPKMLLIVFVASILVAALLAMGVLAAGLTTKLMFKPAGPATLLEAPPGSAPRAMPFAVPVAIATWAVMAWLFLRVVL